MKNYERGDSDAWNSNVDGSSLWRIDQEALVQGKAKGSVSLCLPSPTSQHLMRNHEIGDADVRKKETRENFIASFSSVPTSNDTQRRWYVGVLMQ